MAKGRPIEKWVQEEALRKTEVAFQVDRQRHTLDYWWDQICAKVGVPFEVLQQRSEQGDWYARRDQYWHEVTQELLQRAKHRAVKDRLSELHEIQDLRAAVLDVIRPKVMNGKKVYPVAPHSMEGMVSAFVKLDSLADYKRTAILEAVSPQIAPSNEGRVVQTGDLSDAEIKKFARQVLEGRVRDQQPSEQLALPAEENDDDEDPDAGP